jgi:hypothetical protein
MRLLWNIRRAATTGPLFLALAAGCASDQSVSKTASSGDPLAAQARRFRNTDGDRDGTGLSSESREIEKDLGYR